MDHSEPSSRSAWAPPSPVPTRMLGWRSVSAVPRRHASVSLRHANPVPSVVGSEQIADHLSRMLRSVRLPVRSDGFPGHALERGCLDEDRVHRRRRSRGTEGRDR